MEGFVMRAGLLPLVVVTGGLIAAAVAVALVIGTGDDNGDGGGDSTLSAYFQALNATQLEIRTDYSAVEGQYPDAFVDKQETVDYLNASAETWEEGVGKLEAIDAPDAVAQQHLALVQATDDVSAAFRELRSTAEDADEAELEQIVNDADTTAFDSYTETCTALQTAADENAVLDESGAAVFVVC
jgi:hypothetical protein